MVRRFTKSDIDIRMLNALLRNQHGISKSGMIRVDSRTHYQLFSLIGFGKSGTNWLSSLLNLHPHVRCAGEFNFHVFEAALKQFTADAGHIGRLEPFRSTATQSLQHLYAQVLLCLAADKPGATHLGERTPRPLDEIIHGAPILWIVRDGRDVVISYTYHYLRLKPKFNIQHWNPQIQSLFWQYAENYHSNPPESCHDTARALLAEREWVSFVAGIWGKRILRDHRAAQELKCKYIMLKYEDLHANLDTTLHNAYTFLGLDPNIAERPSRQTNTAPGFGREDALSFYRKGISGDWKNYNTPLFDECTSTNDCGNALKLLGYHL